jgi:hypothetical protein
MILKEARKAVIAAATFLWPCEAFITDAVSLVLMHQ